MSNSDFLEIANKTFSGIFVQKNHLTLDQLRDKFAFDIKLPTKVNDSTTEEVTYSAMPNAESYIKNGNITQYEQDKGWILKKTRYEKY